MQEHSEKINDPEALNKCVLSGNFSEVWRTVHLCWHAEKIQSSVVLSFSLPLDCYPWSKKYLASCSVEKNMERVTILGLGGIHDNLNPTVHIWE